MTFDDANKRYSEAPDKRAFESIHPTKTGAVRSTRQKVCVTVKGAIAAFQPALLSAEKIKDVKCRELGNDIIIISAKTTRKKLLAALDKQRGVIVIDTLGKDGEAFEEEEEEYERATEQVA